ncbi:hypothetical protein [Micromonospora sp. WMMC273]|uniref:hypothetical protein n=1 Tax=Micromonospora sp. WMMC273 TaxID=3015157 RepID=UPI0022B6D416|nr:hypothetical protein [Micromonospora sp. WMMC273]MCZ7478884.1 hypothetical protein [Micromonospora sp. WMMC273]
MTTPVPVTDPVVLPVAVELLGALAEETARVPEPPAVTALRPGDRIELLLSTNRDECCEGLAWVRVVRVYPSREFPAQDTAYQTCSPVQWAVVFELGAARCAPTPGASALPTAQEWMDTTTAVLNDAAAVRRAVAAFMELDIDRMYLAGIWSPLTTEGGCVGGAMQLTVAVPACDTLREPE